jgi:hypothetical protein
MERQNNLASSIEKLSTVSHPLETTTNQRKKPTGGPDPVGFLEEERALFCILTEQFLCQGEIHM